MNWTKIFTFNSWISGIILFVIWMLFAILMHCILSPNSTLPNSNMPLYGIATVRNWACSGCGRDLDVEFEDQQLVTYRLCGGSENDPSLNVGDKLNLDFSWDSTQKCFKINSLYLVKPAENNSK